MANKLYIVGPGWGGYTEMFLNNGWEIVKKMEEADFVLFTGGEDVTPSLYGEKNVASGNSPDRDAREIAAFSEAISQGKNLLGICRGSQFLTVMSGHSLWQDVDRHAIGGTHAAFTPEGEKVDVTSTHHQMMRLDGPTPYQLLLSASRTTRKVGANDVEVNSLVEGRDIEAVFYPKTKAFAFQPHPEMVNKEHSCQQFYFKMIDQLFK